MNSSNNQNNSLNSAHQGYIYQDIIGAYFVAQELAHGKGTTSFHFEYKKTPSGVPDKFDDLAIYRERTTSFIQIKYSNYDNQHTLTKQDFSSSGSYDLALFDLFKTWMALHNPGCLWRVCLAWDKPKSDDLIQTVLVMLPDSESFLPGTTCYKFNCDALWPEHGEVLSSWRALKMRSKLIDRKAFKAFLDCLVLEVNCPKSTLLQDYSQGLEKLLSCAISNIGIGVYPNDHLNVRQVAESLCTIAQRRRATNDSTPISCDEIAQNSNIKQTYGGIEQKIAIDENVLIPTSDRVDQVVSILNEHSGVILTAEPGAGKSWFIENLQKDLQETTQVIKHYCYVALEDPLSLDRITTNVMYGNLITQILQTDEDLGDHMTKRYASNLEQLNILLGNIKKKTLLIVDGIDHIWRVYQKNRGGLTEDETKILNALSQIDYSNPKVSLLIVSQPINQLAELTSFHHCTLSQLPESFVEELLEKHAVLNTEVEDISLSKMIHKKSNGNALYCKYLIDHAAINKTNTSFDWIDALPLYDFNLLGYYQYLYEQIQGVTNVPFALCGADFSVTEVELKEITHLGDTVSKQLTILKPILRYSQAIGYSIYHESFKRFIIDSIRDQDASIDHLIYKDLIIWLKKHSFFESIKAYGHLLKLYYEVDAYEEIAKTISIDFLENSLYNAQPFHLIRQNHKLQKVSLQNIDGFSQMIIVAEQSKIIYELENIATQVLINYLKAIQKIHGEEAMYRVLWDEEHLLVDRKDALRFLVNQAYQGKEIVHWSIIPSLDNIPYDILGLVAVKLLHTKRYEDFDALVKEIYEDPKHKKVFDVILNEVEWWFIYVDEDWIANTPYFRDILAALIPSVSTLEQAVDSIISNKKFDIDEKWEVMLRDVVMLTKTSSKEEQETSIKTLSDYNWFRNWLIYLIKITELSQREHDNKELIDAFTYLVRDLKPFKGEPRACDLYKQLPFIRKSFHQGLLLCNGNERLLTKCCELIEKVTELTTSLQSSFSGPLTDESFLELVNYYLPGKYVLDKYEKYYLSLGSRRVYSDVAEIAFEYAHVLSSAGRDDEARKKYVEGIQALTAYGFRKDRTLSEVLDCSVPYQQEYGSLGIEWFYDLYHMTMTVATHTDGSSTSHYPIEWFKEFIIVYPDAALRFLTTETIESKEANWHQETEFYHILEEYPSFFSPTQWFMLCRSLPLASSSKIISYGLAVSDQIDGTLQDVFCRWLQYLPSVVRIEEEEAYSREIVTQFEERFGIHLKLKEEKILTDYSYQTNASSHVNAFSATSIEEALAFLEMNTLTENHKNQFLLFFTSITTWSEKKKILRQVAKRFKYKGDVGQWVDYFFDQESQEWLYFNVCLFVFVTDGWFRGLHYTHYLKRTYEVNPTETINMLKEILGYYLSGDKYGSSISCNLIKALCELQIEEEMVNELLQTTLHIVKRRLPHPPNSEINMSIYKGLEELNRDEMVVALLIARLKTLTNEKTQGIIWALTYIAQTAPETLFSPYFWAFSHQAHLLPIHRALLLQIIKEYVDQNLIPDKLVGQLISIYPTGFFLEDQYIRSFVKYNVELEENPARSIQHLAHNHDESFFPAIHFKYKKLSMYCGPLTGTYNAYIYKRDKITKAHESYYIRTEKLLTPIVSFANASYEIVNEQFYALLKNLTKHYTSSYICGLRFWLEEIILQVGALTKRPSFLPTPKEFPSFEVRNDSSFFEQDGWVVLSLKEKEINGKYFESKKLFNSSLVLTFGNKPALEEDFYSKYIFNVNQYAKNNIGEFPLDKPICILKIIDTLEYSRVIYVSPFVIRKLGLTIASNIHNGIQACNDKGEVIVKMVVWKNNYCGSVGDGTEIPRTEGVAVMIRLDYFKNLLSLYQEKGWFVLSQSKEDNK